MGKTLTAETQPMDMEALSLFIKRKLEETKMSINEVSRRATAAGKEFEIAPATVWGATVGKWKYVYPTTMRALARGLGVTEQELWDVAQGRADPMPGYVLEQREITLPDTVWKLIDEGAARTRRSPEQYLEAAVAAAEGIDVN